eukprot:scaffold101689_cov30-Tisochrysis_lutea.AAC.1
MTTAGFSMREREREERGSRGGRGLREDVINRVKLKKRRAERLECAGREGAPRAPGDFLYL